MGRHMYAHSTHTHTYMWEVERGRKRSKRAGGQAKCKNGIHERRKGGTMEDRHGEVNGNKRVTRMYSSVIVGPGRWLSK